jgi:hypothetical protein
MGIPPLFIDSSDKIPAAVQFNARLALTGGSVSFMMHLANSSRTIDVPLSYFSVPLSLVSSKKFSGKI